MNHEILTNELDEVTKSLIEKVEKMSTEIDKKDKELSSKDEEIQKLKNELEYLKGIISNKNRKIFGVSSEQVDINQLSLFNEAEKFSDSNAEEPTLEEITYKRAKKNHYIGKKDNLANLERVVIEHKLEGDDLICKDCGELLTEIGVKSTKEIIKLIPAKLVVEEHIIYSYGCKSCEKEIGESNIISAPAPKTIFYNSMASNELIAHTVILKYQHAMPLYRQELYFDMMGATLSRQTLCNWTMSAAEALGPIYNYMKKGKRENMKYDAESDFYICHNDKKLISTSIIHRKSASGYKSEVTVYECENCDNCAHKVKCTKAKGNRKMQVSKTFVEKREISYKNITTEFGTKLRMNRSIQVEGAFGVLKSDYEFNRFLTRGKNSVKTEFILLCFGYNINKLHSKIQNERTQNHLHELKSTA